MSTYTIIHYYQNNTNEFIARRFNYNDTFAHIKQTLINEKLMTQDQYLIYNHNIIDDNNTLEICNNKNINIYISDETHYKRIKVNYLNNNIVMFAFWTIPNDTTYFDLKKIASKQFNIATSDLRFIVNEQFVDIPESATFTYSSVGIYQNLTIMIESPNNKYSVDVTGMTNSEVLKSYLEKTYGFKVEDQVLTYNERTLDNIRLKTVGIKSGSVIKLSLLNAKVLLQFIPRLDSHYSEKYKKKFYIKFAYNSTIKSIIESLSDLFDLDSDYLILVAKGIRLEEDKTISHYNIDSDTSLYLHELLEIPVNHGDDIREILVPNHESIIYFKGLCEKAFGIKIKSMTIGGVETSDNNSINTYDIEEEKVEIYECEMKELIINKINLRVTVDTTIKEFKEMLFKLNAFDGNKLYIGEDLTEDDKKVGDYSGNIVKVVKEVNIKVVDLYGRTLSLNIDNIDSLKTTIFEKLEIEIDKQKLVSDGVEITELKDGMIITVAKN